MSNKLCGTCGTIIRTIRKVGWHINLPHHQSRSTLLQSVKEACGICTSLLEHLQSSAFQEVPSLWDEVFPIKCESDTSSASWQDSFELELTSDGVENLSLKLILEVIEESTDRYIPSSTTDSPESWDLITRWMNQCTGCHKRCNAPTPEAWAPTRLLDIGTIENDYVRLVIRGESFPLNQNYATLSHCWGNTQDLITTTLPTFSQRCENVSHTELPKTFNDAIRIARSLHLRYLWIDSLCIIQDSPEDWSREAGMMSKVYRYSFINIAATGAGNSTEGCFWERDQLAVQPTEFFVRWSNDMLRKRKYHVVLEPHLWARKLTDQPLNRRAWVLQERILSPRVLHFGSEQLFWECREFVACETYPSGIPSSLQGNTIIDIKTLDLGDEPRDKRWPAKYASKSVSTSGTLLGSRRVWNTISKKFTPITIQEVTLKANMKSASIYQDWNAVVELYSLGVITYPKDKLVAISGLASAISIGEKNALGDGYLAGLWQSSLPSHLLWTTEETEKTGRYLKFGTYIAPSWSWASIDGKISFTWCQHNYESRDYLAKLESAEVIWDNMARFGRVISGFLKLSGPVASVLWQKYSPTQFNPGTAKITHIFPRGFNSHKSIAIPPDLDTKAEILFDVADSCNMPKELTLMPVIGTTRRTAHENETVIGLVLQQADAENYSRVGFFYTMRPRASKILRNMPSQTVTII